MAKSKGNSNKNKGSQWERDIAKFLTATLGGSFIRTPHSGAYVGGKNAHRKDTLSDGQIAASKGDIIPPDDLKMVIEAKAYREFPFHQLLSGSCRQLDEWIAQTLVCISEGDVWFTIFKINNRGSYVCFSDEYAGVFALGHHARYQSYIVTEMKPFFEANSIKIQLLCGRKL